MHKPLTRVKVFALPVTKEPLATGEVPCLDQVSWKGKIESLCSAVQHIYRCCLLEPSVRPERNYRYYVGIGVIYNATNRTSQGTSANVHMMMCRELDGVNAMMMCFVKCCFFVSYLNWFSYQKVRFVLASMKNRNVEVSVHRLCCGVCCQYTYDHLLGISDPMRPCFSAITF